MTKVNLYIAPIEEHVKLAHGKEEIMLPTVAFEKFVTATPPGSEEKGHFWTTVVTNAPYDYEQKVLANIHKMREEGASYGAARFANANYHLLNKGIYRPAFLEEKAAKYGFVFRVVLINFKDMKKDNPQWEPGERAELLSYYMQEASHGWSDDTGICMLSLFDRDGYRFDWAAVAALLDLDISNSDKIAKRLKEITRITMLYKTGAIKDLKLHTYPLPEGHEEEYHDGHVIIAREWVATLANHIENPKIRKRWIRDILSGKTTAFDTFRLETPDGQFKGNATAVPRVQIEKRWGKGYDVVTWDGNMKEELKTTDGSYFVTANPMHPYTEPQTNDQSLSWLYGPAGSVHTKLDMITGWVGFMDHTEEAFREGDLPKYLLAENLDISSLADSVTMYHQSTLAAKMRDLTFRWIAQGMPIYASRHLMYMASGALEKKMERAIGRVKGYHRRGDQLVQKRFMEDAKIKYPVIWATYTHVITHEILEVGGYEIPAHKKGKEFYHIESGQWAIPGAAFKAQFRNHGGWDLDDSVMIMCRRFIDEKKGDYEVAVKVRMPNSYGEYSITEEVDWEDFPFCHAYGEVPILDRDVLPPFIDQLQVSVQGLPSSNRQIPASYDMDEALYLLGVALDNPTVGSWVNPQIAYYTTFGTYRSVQLASTEDIVDLLTQKPDPAAFQAVKDDSEQTANDCIWGGVPIDEYVWQTRLNCAMQITRNEKTGKELKRKRPPLHDGYMTEMYVKLLEIHHGTGNRVGSIKGWRPRRKEMVKNLWQPIQELLDIKVPKPILDQAKVIHTNWRIGQKDDVYQAVAGYFADWKKKYGNTRMIPSWFESYAWQQAYGELNRKIMLEIQAAMRDLTPSERALLIAGMYQVCADPKQKINNDAFFFQNPIDGENSPFDYLMLALVRIGKASDIDTETGGRTRYEEKK